MNKKLQFPVMNKYTKFPKEPKISKKNKEILLKIVQWKKHLG